MIRPILQYFPLFSIYLIAVGVVLSVVLVTVNVWLFFFLYHCYFCCYCCCSKDVNSYIIYQINGRTIYSKSVHVKWTIQVCTIFTYAFSFRFSASHTLSCSRCWIGYNMNLKSNNSPQTIMSHTYTIQFVCVCWIRYLRIALFTHILHEHIYTQVSTRYRIVICYNIISFFFHSIDCATFILCLNFILWTNTNKIYGIVNLIKRSWGKKY